MDRCQKIKNLDSNFFIANWIKFLWVTCSFMRPAILRFVKKRLEMNHFGELHHQIYSRKLCFMAPLTCLHPLNFWPHIKGYVSWIVISRIHQMDGHLSNVHLDCVEVPSIYLPIMCGSRGGQGFRTPPPPPPLENYKNIGFLSIILVRIPWKITKLPSQHSMLGHHWPASETPLKWRFAGRPMMARFFVVFGSPHS